MDMESKVHKYIVLNKGLNMHILTVIDETEKAFKCKIKTYNGTKDRSGFDRKGFIWVPKSVCIEQDRFDKNVIEYIAKRWYS